MITLRYASICGGCQRALKPGTYAHYAKGRGVRCNACGPHELNKTGMTTIILPDAFAEGSEDWQRPMGTARQNGMSRAKRNRLPMAERRRLQRLHNE